MPSARSQLDARFLTGSQGALFAVDRRPASETPACGAVLILPPFAEEMNRARRFVATLAERLAVSGFHSMMLDLFGTGDSGGTFAEASWAGWIGDVETACSALADEHEGPPWILGIRTGALLGLEAVRGGCAAAGLACLHPVTNGERFLRQLLRTRIAADMSRGIRVSAAELVGRLEAGDSIEVAGYSLPPGLALPLSRSAMAAAPAPDCPVLWYELGRTAEALQSRRLMPPEAWAPQIAADRAIVGEPFWQIEEPPAVPAPVIEVVVRDFAEHAA